MERLRYFEKQGIMILIENHRQIVRSEQTELFAKAEKALASDSNQARVLIDLTGARFSPVLLEDTAGHLRKIQKDALRIAIVGSMGFDNVFYAATGLEVSDFPYFITQESAVEYLIG